MGYQSIFRPGAFAGCTVIITGGGSGIGRCTAHELASLGAHVALVGRDPGKLERVRQEIRADGGAVSAYPCDIRDDASVIAVVDAVLRERGRIDGLVNNAGGQFYGPMDAFTTKGFEAVVRNNLTGGFIFMREVYTRWMKQHGGAIVNMSASISRGLPGFAHSGAARSGMLTLSETAAREWAGSGVRVNVVAPGLIGSSGIDNYGAEALAAIRNYTGSIPMRRWGNVAEVSSAIVYLLSPAAAYITGACLQIDGGGGRSESGPWDVPTHWSCEPFDGFHRASLPEALKGGPEAPQAYRQASGAARD